MAIFLYSRISTLNKGQTIDNQILQAETSGFHVDHYYHDIGVSGTLPAMQRDGFNSMMEKLQEGDTVLTVEISRIGRSTSDVLDVVALMTKKGVKLRVLNLDGICLVSPMGRLILTVMAGCATFERDLIVERVKSGLARTRASGTLCGRRMQHSPDKIKAILADLQAGVSRMNVAHRHQVSQKTVSTYKKQYSCAEAFKQLEAKWEQLQKQISMKGAV